MRDWNWLSSADKDWGFSNGVKFDIIDRSDNQTGGR